VGELIESTQFRILSERAVEMILKTRANAVVDRRVILDPSLVARQSTGAAPESRGGAE
jgi:DNA-binding LacI/PurR family transcriptional regulator